MEKLYRKGEIGGVKVFSLIGRWVGGWLNTVIKEQTNSTRWLESEHGIRMMRFTNDDVLRGLGAVVETIREALGD